jgi:hypothetical protein
VAPMSDDEQPTTTPEAEQPAPIATLTVPRRSEQEAQKLYEVGLSQVVTAFQMPRHVTDMAGQRYTLSPDLADLAARMPFANFIIREPWSLINVDGKKGQSLSGVDSIFYIRRPDGIGFCGKRVYANGRVQYFLPGEDGPDDDPILMLVRLYRALYERKHRFVEQPVSRQVRRAMGQERGATYREYIVVPKDDVRYASGERPGAILKRLRALHAVRGHVRHLKSGRVAFVKPHIRGKLGTALQPKTYLVDGAAHE